MIAKVLGRIPQLTRRMIVGDRAREGCDSEAPVDGVEAGPLGVLGEPRELEIVGLFRDGRVLGCGSGFGAFTG